MQVGKGTEVTTLADRIRERCLLRGVFTLRSGKTSDHYFDKYRFECDPEVLQLVAHELRRLVPSNVQVLAGLEMGGIPIATAVSFAVVAIELIAISYIRFRYMDTPFLMAAFQVIIGGVLVFLAGILIGSS